jgi:23S rRNA pseudouridine1911/1915/1917 synthase
VIEETHTFTAEAPEERLDRFLDRSLPGQSRTFLQKIIEEGFVEVNGALRIKPAFRLMAGDRVSVRIPSPPPSEVEPEAIPLRIIFENPDLLVVDKPAGMVVHPAPGHRRGTLVGAVLAHAPEVADVGEIERPGIVHRLDKDTSGLILVARNPAAQRFFQNEFADRRAEKTYLALVEGKPPTPEGRVETHIGRDPSHRQRMAVVPESRGRPAVTLYATREAFPDRTMLEVHPLTGRTHQIRVHMAFLRCPIVGDGVYGRRGDGVEARHMLHAWRLRITLPGEAKPREFEAPIPEDFREAVDLSRR